MPVMRPVPPLPKRPRKGGGEVTSEAQDGRICVRAYGHELAAARRVASRTGINLSALVRLALARYLAEQGERVNGG